MAKKWSKCNIHAWSLKSFTSGSCEKKKYRKKCTNEAKSDFLWIQDRKRLQQDNIVVWILSHDRTTSFKRHHAANVVHLRGYAISRSHDNDDVKIRRLSRVQLNNLMTKYSNKNNQLFLFPFTKMNALLRKVYAMIQRILFLSLSTYFSLSFSHYIWLFHRHFVG